MLAVNVTEVHCSSFGTKLYSHYQGNPETACTALKVCLSRQQINGEEILPALALSKLYTKSQVLI